MNPKTYCLKGLFTIQVIAMLANSSMSQAQDKTGGSAPGAAAAQPAEAGNGSSKIFYELADAALLAMQKRAEELKIYGVAVVAYAEGDTVKSWSSKMLVVGKMTNPPSGANTGDNLLGIAYTKASEMADTLKNSGSKVRPPMKGEYGWEGGVTAKGKAGNIIVAFSGGASAEDVLVSKAGLAILQSRL
jgi:hypothetical protein